MRLQSSIDERKRISVEKDNLQAIINAFIQQDAELLKHLYSNDQQQIDQIKLLKKNRSQDSAIDADGDEVEILEFDLVNSLERNKYLNNNHMKRNAI